MKTDLKPEQKIINLIDQLVQELSKSKKELCGVGYIKNLSQLISLKAEYSSNPTKESMDKIYNWILSNNKWPENSTLPNNMFLIWDVMSKLRNLYKKYYIDAETEKGQMEIKEIFLEKAKNKKIDIALEWGPQKFDFGTFPLAIHYAKIRKVIYFSRENIDDCVNDKRVRAEIDKIIDGYLKDLIEEINP